MWTNYMWTCMRKIAYIFGIIAVYQMGVAGHVLMSSAILVLIDVLNEWAIREIGA